MRYQLFTLAASGRFALLTSPKPCAPLGRLHGLALFRLLSIGETWLGFASALLGTLDKGLLK